MGGNCCSTERFYAEEGHSKGDEVATNGEGKAKRKESKGFESDSEGSDDGASSDGSGFSSESEKEPGVRRALSLAADGTFQLDVENSRRNGPHEDVDVVTFRGTFVAKRQYQKIKPAEDPKTLEFKTIKIFGRHSYRNVGVDTTSTWYNWFLLEDGKKAEGPFAPGSPSKGASSGNLDSPKQFKKSQRYPLEAKAEIYTLDQTVEHAKLGKHGPAKAGLGTSLDMYWCLRVPKEVFNFRGYREDDQITFLHVEPTCNMVNNAVSIRLEEHEVTLTFGEGPPLSKRQLPDRSCILAGF